jgi:segregation and condensation protein B
MAKPSSKPPPPVKDLGLDGFQAQPSGAGLSLDQLNQAFAEMLGTGHDPYDSAPVEEVSTATAETAPAVLPNEVEVSAPTEDDGCEITPRSILEAMLFVGSPDNAPLSSERVAGLMRGVRPAEIDELVRDLNQQYAAQGCPYHLASSAEGYRMVLCDEFARFRDKLYGRVRQARLTPAAIEVLSLVAYKGPLTADEISRLRGKPSGSILTLLVRRQLLSLERSSEPPRVAYYSTTRRFLELFKLESLDDLPRSQDLERR